MERQQLRRTSYIDGLFGPSLPIDEATVRFLRPEVAARFAPTLPLALLSNHVDDLFVVPGWLSVRRGGRGEALARERGFVPVPDEQEKSSRRRAATSSFLQIGGDPAGVAATLEVVRATVETGDEADRRSVSLVHGFIGHQKTLPSSDPEKVGEFAPPVRGTGRGQGVGIRVVDNGLAAKVPWTGAASPAAPGDVDPLKGVIKPAYLGRAAGHATFIAGLIHQVAPDASTRVHLVANTEGLVDEFTLVRTLRSIGPADAPDIIVLPFGGYSVKLGSFGTIQYGADDLWVDPVALRDELEQLVKRLPGTLLVASAGNNDSSDRCFPAAFSDDPTFAGHLISVAALDAGGYRYAHSNYGKWVTASALGVRLRSMYVVGRENPDNDPDGPPETFGPRSFAQWSGTSFSAPLVAARVAETLSALRQQYGRGTTAVDAWRLVAATARPQREGRCGVRVLVDGVAHG